MTMENNLKSYQWQYSYKTSATTSEGQPVDILHDFYIPALQRSVCYDRVAGYFSVVFPGGGVPGFFGLHPGRG